MLKNYLNVAYRLLRRRTLTSFVNVAGLSLAVACFIFALSWCQGELSYDCFREGADRILRIWTTMKFEGGDIDWALSAPPLAASLKKLPDVECAVRMMGGSKERVVVRNGEKSFNEAGFFFSDASFFQVFAVQLLEGEGRKALEAPFTCVVSEEVARKYFGSEHAEGKTLTIEWYSVKHDYRITGVMPTAAHRAHFHPSVLASLSSLGPNQLYAIWRTVQLCTYVRLSRTASQSILEAKLPSIIEQAMGPKGAEHWALHSQKITDIHLHSDLRAEIEPNGSMVSVLVIGSAGILVLLIAAMNFVSLSTTGANDRAKAVAIRTLFGASRRDLIKQFAVEHGFLVVLALVLGVLLTLMLLPAYHDLVGSALEFTHGNALLLIALGATITALALIYPAFVLSALPPLPILRGVFVADSGRRLLRGAFVITQFTVATALLACTLVVAKQLRFALSKDLGISTDRTLLLPLREPELQAKCPLLKNEIRRLNGVAAVSSSSVPPTNTDAINSLRGEQIDLSVRDMAVDHDFVQAMGLQLVSGRNFSREKASDSTEAMIVNESAAERLAALGLLEKPLAMIQESGPRKALRVIGIVRDFHYRPLYFPIQPMVMYLDPSQTRYMEVKLSTQNISETLSQIAAKWKEIVPGYPFEYSFLDEDIKTAYKSDQNLSEILGVFSAVSLLISSLGLLGLAAHETERRLKELGVRRVLGASPRDIILLLVKGLAGKIAVGGVIALVLSYVLVQRWLQSFSYKIDLSGIVFAEALAGAFVLAIAPMAVTAFKAATMNPSAILRQE